MFVKDIQMNINNLTLIVLFFLIFLMSGCGSSNNRDNDNKTKVSINVDFKQISEEKYNKISELRIALVKGNKSYLDNELMIKKSDSQRWSIQIDKEKESNLLNVRIIAKDIEDKILYKTKIGTQIDASKNNKLILEESPKTTFSSLIKIKNISHTYSGKNIKFSFSIENTQQDTLVYQLSSKEKGTFSTTNGKLNFSSSTVNKFSSIYTPLSDEKDIKLTLKLKNSMDEIITVPFIIFSDSKELSFYSAPKMTVDIDEMLVPQNLYKLKAQIENSDSKSWSYRWSKIRGATLKSTQESLNQDEIEIEAFNDSKEYPLCFVLDAFNSKGAKSHIKRCLNRETNVVALKKTGQKRSYDTTGIRVSDKSLKDDGFYHSGLTNRYSRNDVLEEVRDEISGLIWQDDSMVEVERYSWSKALSYCTAQGKGWRVPTRKELLGIVDYTKKELTIDKLFLYTAPDRYWSSTSYVGDKNIDASSYAWFVNFNVGNQSSHAKTKKIFVRCVRDN